MRTINRLDPAATAECRNIQSRKIGRVTEARGFDDISIAGHIIHENGVRVDGVTLTLTLLNNGNQRTTMTDDDGAYIINGLSIGQSFKLTPSKEGYQFSPAERVVNEIVYDAISNFTAFGPPPVPPAIPPNHPTLAWTSFYDNPLPPGSPSEPNSDSEAILAQDGQGNTYLAGTSDTEFYSTTRNSDISLVKIDPNGNRLWARTFNGSGNYKDVAVDLAVDPAGNAYVAGHSFVGSGQTATIAYVVLKYAPEGTFLWARYYYGPGGHSEPYSLKVDAAGNAYVTGFSWGLYANYATVKYDANGNEMWVRRYASGFGEIATEVEVDAAGNVYVTGYGGHSVAGGAEDFLTIKYGPDGQQLWINRYDSPPGNRNDQAVEMEIDPNGDLIVIGPSDDFATAQSLIQKIDGVSGKTLWIKNYVVSSGQDFDDAPFELRIDSSGNIIVAGRIVYYFQDDINAYVIKFDGQGNRLWTDINDGPRNHDFDGNPKLAVDAQDNIYLMIQSEGFGNHDLQITRYQPDGTRFWSYRFDNPYKTRDSLIGWLDDKSQTNIFVNAAGEVTAAGTSLVPGQKLNLVAFKLLQVSEQRAVPFDFDGDRKADIAVFRPETGVWYVRKSSDGSHAVVQWGLENDKIVPADYDGDGKTDLAVYRDGTWYVLKSSDGSFSFNQFGLGGDRPIPSDFDNDGRADLSVFRQGIWHQLRTSDNSYKAFQFGLGSDIPIPSDYDNNRRSDAAVFRGGNWYVSYQAELPYDSFQFGISTDIPVPADYDGDGKTDYAVYRAGTWYVRQSRVGFYVSVSWGLPTDIPVPADYDGDGRTDLAVYRDGAWFILRSSDNSYMIESFGLSGDVPIPAAYSR